MVVVSTEGIGESTFLAFSTLFPFLRLIKKKLFSVQDKKPPQKVYILAWIIMNMRYQNE